MMTDQEDSQPQDAPEAFRLRPYYRGMLIGALLVIFYYEVIL